MSVLDPPLERVNYFNGERLEARDFRAEQDYLIRVRRLLNRSLYSPGIVKGLEVTKHPTSKHKVVIAPGLAFDAAGRELVVLDPMDVTAMGAPSTTAGLVLGNFLVISFVEQRGQPASVSCQPLAKSHVCQVSFSGPTRIRSDVQVEVIDSWPNDASGRIVLAQLEMNATCEIVTVHSGVRKYAVAAKPPKVSPISVEGEKDIDPANPKVLYFHVEGGYPESVTLVLRASQFSTLYYSELGNHTHVLDLALADAPAIPAHQHALGELTTDEAGAHSHTITSAVEDTGDHGIELGDDDGTVTLNSQTHLNVSLEGKHTHKVAAGALTDKAGAIPAHNHAFSKKDALSFGAQPPVARGGPPLAYIDDLHALIDGVDITAPILQQLHGRDPATWPLGAKLGDGTATHKLVTDGTKSINLALVAPDLGPGEHKLEFKVAGAGGQLHYNLYVS